MNGHDALFTLLVCSCMGCVSTAPPMPHWEFAGGPYAQNLSCILGDGRSPGTIFAGLTDGEIFLSTDEGVTWAGISNAAPGAVIHRLAVHPEDPNEIFASTSHGAFVSSNRGADWLPLRFDPGTQIQTGCRVIAIDPWNTQTFYAGTQGKGISRSTDGGKHWSPANGGPEVRLALSDVFDIKIDLLQPDIVYAAVAGIGIMRSANAGGTWESITGNFSELSAVATHIVLSRTSLGTLLYCTNAGSIYRTTNGGQAWTQVRKGLESDRILSLDISPADPNVVFAGTATGIIRSADFGLSWSSTGDSLPHVPTTVAVPTTKSSSTLYAFGGGIGFVISTDGGQNWYQADEKLGGASISIIRSDQSGNLVYAVSGSTILRLEQKEQSWMPASAGIAGDSVSSIAIASDVPSIMYATTPAGVFKTTDGGAGWQATARTLAMTSTFFDTHPNFHNRVFASGEGGLFVSTNNGNSWTQARPITVRPNVQALTFMPTNAGIMYASTRNKAVLSTDDGGISWESARFGITTDNILAVTIDDAEPSTIFAWSAAGECFRSTNRGLEWNRYSLPWPVTVDYHIAFDRYDPSSVVAIVGGSDLYFSATGGSTWISVLQGGLNFDVATLHWNASSATIYAGTRSHGVYRLLLRNFVKWVLQPQESGLAP